MLLTISAREKFELMAFSARHLRIDQWEECLEAVREKKVVKAAIVFD